MNALRFFFIQFKNFLNLFLAALGLRCSMRALFINSCREQWLLLLQNMGSRYTGFSSCGVWT